MGYGKGVVLGFNRAKIGASSHLVDFGSGATKVSLERKGNGKTPYLVMSAEAVAADGRGGSKNVTGELGAVEDLNDAKNEADGDAKADVDARPLPDDDDEDDYSREEEEDEDDDDCTDEYEDETDDEDIALLPKRTQSLEWEGVDDPGYLRLEALGGLVPFGADDEPPMVESEDGSETRVPEGWETAVSRSTGKTYFINTITGESQYEFPAGPAKMYADEIDLESMMVASTAQAAAPSAGSDTLAAARDGSLQPEAPADSDDNSSSASAAAEALLAAEKAEAERWSCMSIKFYFEPNRTGFEATTGPPKSWLGML
eukprot:SAG31_NODE_769_length_12212_cov_5.357508_7_plen_315_part_00